MYDAFKDLIWKELGLLDPNWFEVQATQASLDEGNGVDSYELRANQEGIFKTPLEKTATESQLFSTPKVFRHSRIVSPDTEDEPLFTVAHEKETLPWMATQSPCLFQPSKQSVSDVKCEGVQAQSEESFDFLATPKKSPDSYVKHISESLGAHINPDISWTSSLNTPPGLSGSTLILSKKEESPCPVNVTAERNGFLVRKLFPSLSNSSPKTWKKSAVSSSSQSAVFPVADGCPESPLNQSESHWQQKVPDAVAGEEEVCSADGAETVPSNFFANSSSALRKVKLNRVKRKQIIQTNVDVCIHGDVSKADNGASSEEAAAEMESGALPSTPQVKTGYTAISQWSPLNLSQISSCAVGSSMTSPAVTDSDQFTKPSVKTTDSGFIRKKRTFVYTVAATKSQAQCQDSEFQKMDPTPKISDSGFRLVQEVNTESLENTPGKAESQSTKNVNEFVGEPKTQSVGSKLQDVDMSQLCRDFAQDFSQMTDVKLAEGTNFSPAACLSAMKQAKQKAKQANLPNDHSNNRLIPTSSITEGTMTDSGLQSGIADVTHETSLSFALPCLEKVGLNGHLFDVKTKMHNFQSTTGSGKEKVDAEVPLQGSGKGQTLDHGKETNLHMESTSTRQSGSRDKTLDESNCAEPAGTRVSLLFSNESGFKTASNKGIHISPANLERAKRLLEETEDEKTFRDHSCKTYHAVKYKGNSIPETMKNIPTNLTLPPHVEKSFGNISSQLTASEKADVKELCVLLEEADSQFEFTQFKPAKIIQNGQDDHNPPEKQDKDLDPAFLADIDFDDSFSSDGGKQPAVAVVSDKTTSVSESITNEETAKATNHCTEMSVSSLLKKETYSLDSLSESITEDRICLKSVEPNILPQTEGTEASVLENNSTLTHGETFRTAGGNVLKVSKKCLSKARALFADLENNLSDQKPSDKQNRGNASKTEQKCDIHSDVCGKDLGFTLKETCDVGKEIDNCFSKLDGVACSNKNVPSVGDKSDGKSLKNNQIDTTVCESGFRRASGKGISISAKYMQEAEAVFKDCHAMGHREDKKIKVLPESAASKNSFTNFKSPQVSISKESVAGCTKFENVNAALIAHHTKGLHLAEVETKSRFTAALKHEDGKPFSTSKPFAVLRTSNSMAPSALENVCSGDGFCTAAGKNIRVSAAAMRKAESLLNHIQTPEEINKQANQRELTSKTKGLHDEMSKLDNGCFETVGGKENKISSTAQKKAALLREYEKPEDEISSSPQHTDPRIPVTNLWSGGFLAASGKPVVLSYEALEKAKALFGDISLNMDNLSETAPVKRDRKPEEDQSNAEMLHSGFTTAGAAKDHASQKNILKARDHLKECDDLVLVKAMEEEDALFTYCDLGNNAMLASLGSKKGDLENPFPDQRIGINISEDAGKRCFRETNEQKQKENLLPQASCGFKTASGGRVDVSFEALKRAQTLLGDCVGVEDKVNAAPPESKAIAFPIKNGGFQSASGKPVVLSSEALRKAKSLFSDIGLSAEDPNASQTRKSCKNQDGGDNTEIIWCGFTSARGERVDVLKKNLQKAQVIFKELNDLASTKVMQEEDAFFADCDAGISDEMLEKDTKGKANPRKHYQEKMRVDISTEAGCSRDADKRVEHNEKILPQASRGFQTASGKRVDVSSEALKRAQTLLGDCVGVEDKVNAAPPESKAIAFPIRNGGFQSASGKPVVLSSEALRKAKSLFSDIGLSAEDPNASQTRKSCTNQDGSDNTEIIWCGFTSARGERVDVSKKNLQKAQVVFKELDDLASTKAMQEEDAFFADCDAGISDEMLEKDTKGKANPRKHYQEEMRVDISSEAGCSRDADKRVEQNEKILPQASRGFQTASGKRVDVSSEALKRAQTLLSEFEGLEDKTNTTALQSKVTARPHRNVGFHSASGKPVALSTEAVEKAKSLFGDITFSAEDPDSSQTMKTDGKQDSRNETEKICCGFTTARGEKVSVSQKNIQMAKFLFKELDDLSLTKAMQETDNFFTEEGWTTDGKREINQTNKAPVNESGSAKRNVSQLTPDERETGRISEDPEKGFIKAKEKEGSSLPAPNGGFQTASGKTVAVSCEALSRAKLLLSESKTDEERTSLPLSQTPIHDPVLTNGGFFAASGKPLVFSSESLQKAKTLFSNISLTTALPHRGEEKREGAQNEEKVKCALTNVEATNPVNSEIPKLRDLEGTSTPKSSLTSANRKKHSGVESCPTASSEGQRGGFVVYDLNTESSINTSKVKGTDESSDPKLQSLNLAGCTETQEALDCMEALLEDEFLVGQNLLTTSELLQQPEEQKSNCTSTEESRTRKRRCAEDLTAHPPSKRRLLEDFGRNTDGPSGSGLHSIKICPNGLMDRGVFKYSASLHPNVTKPHRDAKTFVDTRFQATTQTRRSDPGGDRSAPSKMPAFVPPFIRNTKRDIPNKPEATDRKKAPAFVPPFKKHRSVPPESSAKQQDNGLRHPSLAECNSRTDAPGSTTDVVPSADSANTSMTINQSVPGSVGPVSATETLHTDGMLSRSQDGTQNIELARDMQDMRIRKKKRQTIRPLPGSLFLTKTSGVMRIPLRAAVNGKNPARYSAQELYECGVHTRVPEVTGANAESFRFNLLQFVKQETLTDGGGVQLADGGWLIPSNDWTAGKEEFYRALCDTAGVDPKLISEQWVYNHYRWIVWKQASMERSFPAAMGSLCLTPEQVLLQLKYRYDVEVDHSRRPALRKIMERDDTPAKTLVLCVCDVVSRGHSLNAQSRSNTKTTQSAETKAETPFAVIWLTDGWYAIKAQLDEPLTAMLHKGLLAVGGKLMIHGAQLVGSQDACSPLEAPDSLMLKICANSTRRARWDAKLGFHRDPRPFLLPLSCLFSNGGPVGCVDIIVLRSYPMQWMERKSDGGVVFRSARAEEKEARRFDSHKQKAIERLFAKVQAEFEKEEEGSMKPQRRRQTISKQDLANLQDGVELYEAVGDDPAYLEAHLSEQQMESLQAYRRSLMEKKQAALQDRYRRALDAEDSEMSCPKRDATPVWRLCVADSSVQSSCVYQLNLWRPSSDLQSLLKEGCRFKVYNLVASDGKKRSSVDTVQLTGTKNTKFQELQAPQEWLSSRFQQRVSTDFVDLQNEEFKPLCGDVDLVGYVISVIDQQGSSPAFYLVDEKLDFVKVRCFSSLSQAGLEDVVKPRVLLALSNLQLRGQSMYPTPVVYAGDLTAFSTNPKEIHLQEAIYQLKNMVQCQDNFFRAAEDKLAHLVKSDDVRSPSLRQQTPASATDRRQDSKTSVSFQRPVKSLGSFTPVSSNLPAAPSSAEKDPKILKRRRALDYLSRIPSPPPVSPLGSAVSPCVKKTFNPPRRSGPPSTLNPVQTAAPKPSDAAVEGEWVNDEELAMIDTQALHVGSLF